MSTLRSYAWLVGLIILVGLWVFLERPPEQKAGTTVLRLVVFSGERDQVFWRLIRNGDPKLGIKGFESEHPEIRLEFIKAGEGDKVGTMIAGGDAPDVVNIGAGENFYHYKAANVMRDLTPLMSPQDLADIERDFYPVARNAMMEGGKYYALPWNLIPFITFYNKRVFDRFGVPYPSDKWTWADYEAAAKKMTVDENGDGYPDVFGTNFAQWQDGYYTWIYQNGGRVVSKDGKRITFDDPKVVETIAFLHRMSRIENLIPNDKNRPKAVGGQGLFSMDKQGMLGPTGSFYIPQFRGEDFKNVEWDIAPTPMGPTGKRASVVATSGFGVTTQSRHPKEAYELVKYLSSHEGQAALAISALFVPARKSVATDMKLMNPTGVPQHMEAVLDAVEKGYAFVPPWTGRRWGDFQDYLNTEIGDYLFSNANPGDTPAKVAKRIADKGNVILAEEAAERAGTPLPTGPIAKVAMAIGALIIIAWGFKVVSEARKSRIQGAEQVYGYLSIAPWLIGFIVFAAGPILFSMLLSLCRWSNLSPPSQARFIGLDNFAYLLSGKDDAFLTSLTVTAKYTIWAVPLGLTAGLILALFMNSSIRGINWYRTIFYLPAILPGIATTMLWKMMFVQNGLLNWALSPVWPWLPLVLRLVGLAVLVGAALLVWSAISAARDDPGYGRRHWRSFTNLATAGVVAVAGWFLFQAGSLQVAGSRVTDFHKMPDWLGDPRFTIPAILIMGLWGAGGGMMIYLAGLQNVPTELYNAAEVDGAGGWHKFRHVTLPMLSPVLFFNLVMGIIGTFQVFGSAFVLFGSEGGPKHSALFYGLYLYRKAFEQFDIGLGAALAWILFVIILAFTLIIFKSSPMWVYYEGSREGRG
ncbi:MAG TPA: extracellular solute-binding protein [Armatimonadota bacterium]